MGEFLLSFLGFDHDGTVIFTRRLKGSHYNVGDAVPFVYPNQHRKTKRSYYRILEKFYEPELIVKLLHTQDPNVIDQNGFVAHQRKLQDEDIYNIQSTDRLHHTFQSIGEIYGWHKGAIELAIKRHKDRLSQSKRDAGGIQDTTPLTPPKLTQGEKARIDNILNSWGE